MKLAWPRGKYNGERITGLSVKVRINVALWTWKLFRAWNGGCPIVGWLCVFVYFNPEYEHG